MSKMHPKILIAAMVVLSACTNSRLVPKSIKDANITTEPDSGSTSSYRISNVTVANQAEVPTFSVFFDSSSLPSPITDNCSTKSSNTVAEKPCLCQFSWQQVNPFSSNSSPVQRLIFTPVITVQSNMVSCAAPDIYSKDNEVPVGTALNVSIVSASGSPMNFATTQYKHTKNSGNTSGGSFQDAQGRYFDDILRYTCFEQFQRGMSITSKPWPVEGGSQNEQVKVPLASQFCVAKSSGAEGGVENCTNIPAKENSAQAYYYNLYTRESELGGINYANQRYVCPRVKEPLITGMGPGHHWPLDSSFALSLGPTSDFPIGVEAFTKLANGATDAGSQGSVCYPPQSQGSTDDDAGEVPVENNDTLVRSCLGFAAKPNTDGTCPYFKDSTGHVRHTFRLRRFMALYPAVFDSSGAPMNQAQAMDTIYVLDRPVYFDGADVNKPYTMRGPKPCPFAFFDHKGVIGVPDALYPGGVRPVYAGTNNSGWRGKNVDGIQLPNTDSVNSCAAVLPVFNDDLSILSLATVHQASPVYKSVHIRPVRPWSPHYVEDTDFLACAPQSNVLRDPPLHFAKDTTTGNIGWCAEAYPTQNDNVAALDKRPDINSNYFGKVQPFTSHVVKNTASVECTAQQLTSIPSAYPPVTGNACPAYPGTGNPTSLANHPEDLVVDQAPNAAGTPQNVCAQKTCDRTVTNQALTWPKFPLLAPPGDVEKALISDTTYGCVLTYDNGSGKTGKQSPSEGCCGLNVSMLTGIPESGETNASMTNLNAHLEPDQRCLIPKY